MSPDHLSPKSKLDRFRYLRSVMDWYDIKFTFAMWSWQTWPFRALAWLRMRRVPTDKGFGKFADKDDENPG